MKKTLNSFLFLCLMSYSVLAQITNSGGETIWENNNSAVVSLNGNWKFRYISGSVWTSYNDFYTTSYDASLWSSLQVPSNWEMKGITSSQYVIPVEAIGLYRTNFNIPIQWADSNVYVRFDGVLMGFEFWVNGNYVGKWESGYNSRQFNITPYLNSGNNLLAVRVYTRYPGYEFDTHDDWACTGIFRDVTIFPVAEEHLNYFKVESKITGSSNADLTVKYAVSKFASGSLQNIQVKGELYDATGSLVDDFITTVNESEPGKSDTLKEVITLGNAKFWTAETPYLYTLKMTVLNNGVVVQNFDKKVGVREIKIVNKQILLNNQSVKFRGVNYHETDPYEGKVLSRQHRLNDLLMMKKANINYIRTAHYPPHSDFFDLCDSLGFYVTCEVPFGFGDNYLTNYSYQPSLLNRADATVSRHQNHPSVLIWSVGNENEITNMTAEVGLHVAQIDSTRLICYPQAGGMFYWRDYNNYPAHITVFAPHYPDVATLNHYITEVERPLLITEMSHSLGSAFEDHDKLWEIIQQNTVTAGAAVWEWADQAIALTGNRTDNYTKTDHVWLTTTNYLSMNGNQGADGIVYAQRTPQSDYWEVRKNYAQVRVLDNEIPVSTGTQNISIQINNRYDFVALQDVVSCEWYLTKDKDTLQTGTFIPTCNVGQTINQTISLTITGDPSLNVYILHLNFFNSSNQNLNDHHIRLIPAVGGKSKMINLLSDAAIPLVPALTSDSDSIKVNSSTYNFSLSSSTGMLKMNNSIDLIQQGPFIRTGRRVSLAEETVIPSKLISKYIMNNSVYTSTVHTTTVDTVLIKGSYLYDNNNIRMQGNIDYKLTKNGALQVDFDMTPSTTLATPKLFQESGIAFLLNKNITDVRWLGFGPYSSYKGKQNLNNYGIYYKNENDIYFDGNKRGVDIALLTDINGNGILIVADSANISFEKTDEGIIVTYNTHVSGLGSKFAETAYPVRPTTMGDLKGQFYVLPVEGNNWYNLLDNLFGNPSETGATIAPFLATSDTYYQKFNTLIDGFSGCLPSVTASTSQTGNGPENTLDDNLASRWYADGDGVYITYQFCSESSVEAVKISFQNGNSRVFTFDFLCSTDGVNYTTVQTGVQNSGTTSNLEVYTISPAITANYFRIVGHGNSQNTWTSIQEVKFTAQETGGTSTSLFKGDTKIEVVKIFPNPSGNELTIIAEDQIEKIEIFNSIGIKVKEQSGTDASIIISVSSLKSGIYTIKITTDKKEIHTKFEKN